MSDPEPCRMKHTEDPEEQRGWCCRMKHTEDPEEQRGWCLFFIHSFMMLENIHVRNIQAVKL